MKKTIITLGLVFSSQAVAVDAYFCTADKRVSFYLNRDTGAWEGKVISLAKGNRLVKKSNSGIPAWEVSDISDKGQASMAYARCDKDAQYLQCKGIVAFKMNKATGRYLATSSIGYWNSDPNSKIVDLYTEGAVGPYMEIGNCKPW